MERTDDYIQLDNTRVKRRLPFKIKLTRDLLLKLLLRKLQQASALKLGRIYDTVKAEYYKNMQNFYNLNAFGYGIQGNQTGHDYTTNKGLLAIQSNFDYAKNNALNLIELTAGAGLSAAASSSISKGSLLYFKLTKGKFLTPSKRGSLGTMKQYTKDGTIGSGAEAVVINNTPITVGKITTIPLKEMLARNAIPNTVESKYIGFVKDGGVKLPTYILRKVKTLTEHTFPKYISRLDKSMQKAGFRRVTDPNVLYRAYTNGTVVVDDVSPGNVGLDWLRRPRMIDFNLQTVPEWIALGFTLKNGGKLFNYKK